MILSKYGGNLSVYNFVIIPKENSVHYLLLIHNITFYILHLKYSVKSFQNQYTFFPVPWWTPFTPWISPHWSRSLPVSHKSLVSFWIACSTSKTSNTGEIMYIPVIRGGYFQRRTQNEKTCVIKNAWHWQWLRYLFTKIRKFHVLFVNFNLSIFVYIYFEWMILNLNMSSKCQTCLQVLI